METINKKALIDLVSEKTNITKKDAGEIIEAVFGCMKEELMKGNTIDIVGFAKISVKETAPRMGVNPSTGEKIQIAASKKIAFKASKALKDSIQ